MQNLQLPRVLQFTDDELRNMTVMQMRNAFIIAEDCGVLKQFTEVFWKNINRVRSEPSDATVTNVLRTLEDRKRALGRKYDAVSKRDPRHPWFADIYAIQYNDIEYQIRWLCINYNVQRNSKAYLLKEATE